jgi:hypothetical protein
MWTNVEVSMPDTLISSYPIPLFLVCFPYFEKNIKVGL